MSGRSSRAPTRVTMPGSVSPGQTALTRTSCGPASTASIFGEHDRAALGDRVGADRRLGPHARVRGGDDDGAAAGRAQMGQARARRSGTGRSGSSRSRRPRRRPSVSLSGPSCSTPAFRTTASSPPSTSTAVAHRAVDRLAIARVGLEERRAVTRGDALAALAVASGQDDARALGAQPLHDGLPDAGGATGRRARAGRRDAPSRGDSRADSISAMSRTWANGREHLPLRGERLYLRVRNVSIRA